MSIYGRHKSITAKLITSHTLKTIQHSPNTYLFIFMSINIHHTQQRFKAELKKKHRKGTDTWFIVRSDFAEDAQTNSEIYSWMT